MRWRNENKNNVESSESTCLQLAPHIQNHTTTSPIIDRSQPTALEAHCLRNLNFSLNNPSFVLHFVLSFCYFIKKNFFNKILKSFMSSFRFTGKWRGAYRDFPRVPHPHTCIVCSVISICHQWYSCYHWWT